MKILQWCMSLFSKKSQVKDVPLMKEPAPAMPVVVTPAEGSPLDKAIKKRERRKHRNVQNHNRNTKGAFGKPKAMRRDRGD